MVYDHRCALEDDGLDPDEIDRRCVEFEQLDDEARHATSTLVGFGQKGGVERDNVRRVEALWRRKAWARALPRHKLARPGRTWQSRGPPTVGGRRRPGPHGAGASPGAAPEEVPSR